MKQITLAGAMAAMAMLLAASPADAKGCVKGALVGGIAGHYAGHHGVLGAVAGCIIGHHRAKQHSHSRPAAAPGQ